MWYKGKGSTADDRNMLQSVRGGMRNFEKSKLHGLCTRAREVHISNNLYKELEHLQAAHTKT